MTDRDRRTGCDRAIDDRAIDIDTCATCRHLRLEAADPQRLRMVPAHGGGWASWADIDDGRPSNWRRPLVNADWPALAQLVMTTAQVLGFSDHLMVEVETFAADYPCRECAWGDLSEWS